MREKRESDNDLAAEHGVAAERLDRSDFGIQMQKKACSIYSVIPSSRPLNAKPLDGALFSANMPPSHRQPASSLWRN
jgi:hypothetical protein